MIEIHFNQIYIIESLQSGDKLTGTDLYNNLLQYQSINHPYFKAILKSPQNKKEWNDVFDEIYNDCSTNGNAPILHFEGHGSSDKKGLVLTSGELVRWKEIYEKLRRINIVIKNELFITMAVCHGNYLLRATRFDSPSAFRGIIGSFEEIQENDLVIRYEEFYRELFSSLDINKAYDSLKAANPSLPNSYKCYSAEYVFAISFLGYAKKYCSDKALEIQATKIIANRNLRQNKNEVKELIKKRQKIYFNKSYKTFFMIDKYPGLVNTVNFPNDFYRMKDWFQSFHQDFKI